MKDMILPTQGLDTDKAAHIYCELSKRTGLDVDEIGEAFDRFLEPGDDHFKHLTKIKLILAKLNCWETAATFH